MFKIRLKKFVLLSLFISILSVVLFQALKYNLYNSVFKEKYALLIGVLSSPENFEKRLSLRNTWLKLTSSISAVYLFVIGKYVCDIHPADRISPYSCIENYVSLPENATTETEFVTVKKKIINEPGPSERINSIGFGFRTLCDITVKKLGIVKSFLKYVKDDMKVKLVSSQTKEILASVTISYETTHTVKDDDFIFKAVNPIIMRKDSEARVVMEFKPVNMSYPPSCNNFKWNLVPGVIYYMQLIQPHLIKPLPFDHTSCSYISMSYSISDVNKLKIHLKDKGKRKIEWLNYQKKLVLKIRNESEMFGDIILVNVTDVYQNLPQKLVQFFIRVVEIENFHFLLKADDDSFIDVLRVYNHVVNINKDAIGEFYPLNWFKSGQYLSHFWWWSNFREFWKVQETGKWREDKYRSPAYPSFPCGGGYVLSRGLVNYLSYNSKYLDYFQGEDVSLGIWLSGLKTIRHRTQNFHNLAHSNGILVNVLKKFGGEIPQSQFKNLNNSKSVPDNCEWTCDNKKIYDIPLCNKVELTLSQMYGTWRDYLKNGFIS